MVKAYLAGPDVFKPDSLLTGAQLKGICEAYGLTGLYPMDSQVPERMSKHETAHLIAQSNIDLIREADCVLANLESFRGHEPDSGTCFEVGMAIALGKPVFAYFPDHAPLIDKVPTDAVGADKDGMQVEDFDLPLNLMLATTCQSMHKGFRQAVEAAALYHLARMPLKAHKVDQGTMMDLC